eukprot:COSAG01_NODE_5362_length_4309_cov_6.080266_5_plen_197_part_00
MSVFDDMNDRRRARALAGGVARRLRAACRGGASPVAGLGHAVAPPPDLLSGGRGGRYAAAAAHPHPHPPHLPPRGEGGVCTAARVLTRQRREAGERAHPAHRGSGSAPTWSGRAGESAQSTTRSCGCCRWRRRRRRSRWVAAARAGGRPALGYGRPPPRGRRRLCCRTSSSRTAASTTRSRARALRGRRERGPLGR